MIVDNLISNVWCSVLSSIHSNEHVSLISTGDTFLQVSSSSSAVSSCFFQRRLPITLASSANIKCFGASSLSSSSCSEARIFDACQLLFYFRFSFLYQLSHFVLFIFRKVFEIIGFSGFNTMQNCGFTSYASQHFLICFSIICSLEQHLESTLPFCMSVSTKYRIRGMNLFWRLRFKKELHNTIFILIEL